MRIVSLTVFVIGLVASAVRAQAPGALPAQDVAAIVGRPAAEAYMRGFPPFKDLTVEPRPEQRDAGKYIEIWRKQADGTWKTTRDISTSDGPAAAAAPARQK